MKQITFDGYDALLAAFVSELRRRMAARGDGSFGIILPGGRTPAPAYRILEAEPAAISPQCYLIQSDERLVPETSEESNFRTLRGLVEALSMPADHVLRVRSDLGPERAAEEFDGVLRGFIAKGGRISVAFLGVGVDGHTASLFDKEDLGRSKGRFAAPIHRPAGPARVSLTPEALSLAEQAVFLAAGPEKAQIVRELSARPSSVVAGLATDRIPEREIWYAK